MEWPTNKNSKNRSELKIIARSNKEFSWTNIINQVMFWNKYIVLEETSMSDNLNLCDLQQ